MKGGKGGKGGEGVTRDEVRASLTELLLPFMPRSHTLRATSEGAVPPRCRAQPGCLCNRHCAPACIRECAGGFLMAMDVSVAGTGSGGEATMADIATALGRAMRRFHPDRNTPRRVGLARAMHCEEVSKDLSLLQSLMETMHTFTFVALVTQDAAPSAAAAAAGAGGVNASGSFRMKLTLPTSGTVLEVKHRVREDNAGWDVGAMEATVQGRVLSDAMTLGSIGIKENGIMNVRIKAKAWTTF